VGFLNARWVVGDEGADTPDADATLEQQMDTAGEYSEAVKPVPAGPAEVALRRNEEGAWRFFVNGEEFPVRGAGGAVAPGLLEKLKEAGGNCVRTWGIKTMEARVTDGKRFIDRAHELGLMVVPGIWIGHERHGFDYTDEQQVARQREKVVRAVRAYRDHPAVLAWGLGNEMEGPAARRGNLRVYRELEQLARLVKREDPDHPVMTVIAFNREKARAVMQHCPGIDILGVNAYGGAAGAGETLRSIGWEKPFVLTEFGTRGAWEVSATGWGAPLEPTSQEKARTYYSIHRLIYEMNEGKDLCLGTFAFLWGWKQERTATWHGMFLPSLEKLPQVDAMTKAWTGNWPENRCPKIRALTSPAYAEVVEPETVLPASLDVEDPNGDPLTFEWIVVAESTARSVGGDAEAAPPAYEDLLVSNNGPECLFKTPAEQGNYRLFVSVHDGRGGAATANFPFRVE
jgi:hypothetical protein